MTATALPTKARTRVSRLQERVSQGSVQVHRAANRLDGVRILGPESQNGRRYLIEAVRGARSLYEGRAVNANHPRRADANEDRSVYDRIGWLEGVEVDRDGGLVGTLHLLESHPLTAAVMEAAERNPALFGLSHNVEGRTRRDGGVTIVEEITRVRSVDLVADPASTKSLFEQRLREVGGAELGEPVNGGEPDGDIHQDEVELLAAIRDIIGGTDSAADKVSAIELLLQPAAGTVESVGRRGAARQIREAASELARLRRELAELQRRVGGDQQIVGGIVGGGARGGWSFPENAAEAGRRLFGGTSLSTDEFRALRERIIRH